LKNYIFQDITPCSPLKVKQRFGEKWRHNLQDWRIRKGKKPQRSTWQDLGLQFDLGDGGYMFLRNVGSLSTDYTALYLITAARNSN
jgi:hypothetical protein